MDVRLPARGHAAQSADDQGWHTAPADSTPAPSAPSAPRGDVDDRVPIGYLKQEVKRPHPTVTAQCRAARISASPVRRLALKDNNTTGRFTKQQFTLDVERVPIGGDAVAALAKLVASGHHFILVDAPAKTLLKLSDSVNGQGRAAVQRQRAEDEELRQEDCRANVLHTAPDRYMLADALAQYLVWKKWPRWFVVKGIFPEDLAYLDGHREGCEALRWHDRRGARIQGARSSARRSDSASSRSSSRCRS